MVCEIKTNKNQVLHRMPLQPFTSGEPLPDVQITSQQRKPDPGVIFEHDDLCARAWESDFEKLSFDNDQDEPDDTCKRN